MGKFPTTYFTVIDYGNLGVCIPETQYAQSLEDIYANFVGGEYLGDLVAVYRVSMMERTIDVSKTLATMIRLSWQLGNDIPDHARAFADRFGFDLTDEPEEPYSDFVREHSTLCRQQQGV